MVRISQKDYLDYLARREAELADDHPDTPDDGPESRLQGRIEEHCRKMGWYFFHDRSRAVNERGFPDLVIALPDSVTLWLELKSAKGRMTPEQKRVMLILKALGHHHYKVKAYSRYLRIINEHTTRR